MYPVYEGKLVYIVDPHQDYYCLGEESSVAPILKISVRSLKASVPIEGSGVCSLQRHGLTGTWWGSKVGSDRRGNSLFGIVNLQKNPENGEPKCMILINVSPKEANQQH